MRRAIKFHGGADDVNFTIDIVGPCLISMIFQQGKVLLPSSAAWVAAALAIEKAVKSSLARSGERSRKGS